MELSPFLRVTIFSSLAVLFIACGANAPAQLVSEPDPEPPPPSAEEDSAPAEGVAGLVPNGHLVREGLLVGGQPSLVQVASISEAGYETVISLRADGEPGTEGEQEAVEAAGMRFVSLPITGAADLTVVNAERLSVELAQAGQTLLHCGSGNRAGAMVALLEVIENHATPSAALQAGRAAGLTGLEAETAAVLAEVCQDLPDGNCDDD